MSATRKIHWATAMHAVEADREKRALIREEPLRSGLRGGNLVAWRGKSGRRYVASTYSIHSPDAYESRDGVILAVRRDARGAADLLAVRTVFVGAADVVDWAAVWAERGATEIHFHGLSDTNEKRREAVRDLTGTVPARAAA